MIFMQNNNKKQFFFYIENNQIMILSALEKTEDAFHFTSAKTGSGFLPEKSI